MINFWLTRAVENSNTEQTEKYLKEGADPLSYDLSAFQKAARQGNLEIFQKCIQYTLENHVDFNDLSNSMERAKILKCAVENGQCTIVGLLLELGLCKYSPDNAFALTTAAEQGDLPIVQLLLENSWRQEKEFYEAINAAAKNNQDHVVYYLYAKAVQNDPTFDEIIALFPKVNLIVEKIKTHFSTKIMIFSEVVKKNGFPKDICASQIFPKLALPNSCTKNTFPKTTQDLRLYSTNDGS